MSAVLVDNGIDKGAIWHFGEVAKEQRALADGKAWADLSHRTVIEVAGEDRLTWLHSLTTQHLEMLEPGTWIDALILDPQGQQTVDSSQQGSRRHRKDKPFQSCPILESQDFFSTDRLSGSGFHIRRLMF